MIASHLLQSSQTLNQKVKNPQKKVEHNHQSCGGPLKTKRPQLGQWSSYKKRILNLIGKEWETRETRELARIRSYEQISDTRA
jgi:hypothetical protein